MLMTSLLKSLTDSALIDYAMANGLNFAMFRLPGHADACIYVSNSILIGREALTTPGFVTAPFRNDKLYSIPPTYERHHKIEADIPTKGILPQTCFPNIPDWYKTGLRHLITTLNQRKGKTVIAATRQADYKASVIEIFDNLANAYPNAFIYSWHIASSPEVWIGATPELLLTLSGREINTMALAGTRATETETKEWDSKNTVEQAIVTEFIVNTLNAHNISAEVSAPHTLRAGHIEHICTAIKAKCDYDIDIYALLCSLAPTPAVCGLPKDTAMREIKATEPFERNFYGGYCGPVKSPDELQLYVSLRCMSLLPEQHQATLYAGGGITECSEPMDEWREINSKMYTLASVLGDKLCFNDASHTLENKLM